MSARTILLPPLSGLVLALASSIIPGRSRAIYSEIMGCEQGCDVAAAGWPFSYVIDYPGISVVGAANLMGALAGEDHFRLYPFLATLIFWTLVAAAIPFLWWRALKG